MQESAGLVLAGEATWNRRPMRYISPSARAFVLHAPHVKLQAAVLELAARLNSEVAGLCQSRADSELRVSQRSTSVGSRLLWEGQSR